MNTLPLSSHNGLPRFEVKTGHEVHALAMCELNGKWLLYIISFPGADLLHLEAFDTQEAATATFAVAMLAMQRVAR